jgi:hypothetical protein
MAIAMKKLDNISILHHPGSGYFYGTCYRETIEKSSFFDFPSILSQFTPRPGRIQELFHIKDEAHIVPQNEIFLPKKRRVC